MVGPERAVAAKREAVVELGQADEDEGQQRPAVPLVVEEDMQVVEHVLVKQMGLVEEEDGVDALTAEVFDVGRDGEEDRGGGSRRRKSQRETELAGGDGIGLVIPIAELDRSPRRTTHPGCAVTVDYSGKKPCTWDEKTGERIEVELFVAVLGASNFTFAEATRSQRGPDWIGSHTRAFAYFGGVTRAMVCDQLRPGVTLSCRYEPGIQRTYEEMAEHSGTTVLPARPWHPRDRRKAHVDVLVPPWPGVRRRHRLREFDKAAVRQLAACRWVHEHQNVIVKRRKQEEQERCALLLGGSTRSQGRLQSSFSSHLPPETIGAAIFPLFVESGGSRSA